jgi:hypothetical protein
VHMPERTHPFAPLSRSTRPYPRASHRAALVAGVAALAACGYGRDQPSASQDQVQDRPTVVATAVSEPSPPPDVPAAPSAPPPLAPARYQLATSVLRERAGAALRGELPGLFGPAVQEAEVVSVRWEYEGPLVHLWYGEVQRWREGDSAGTTVACGLATVDDVAGVVLANWRAVVAEVPGEHSIDAMRPVIRDRCGDDPEPASPPEPPATVEPPVSVTEVAAGEAPEAASAEPEHAPPARTMTPPPTTVTPPPTTASTPSTTATTTTTPRRPPPPRGGAVDHDDVDHDAAVDHDDVDHDAAVDHDDVDHDAAVDHDDVDHDAAVDHDDVDHDAAVDHDDVDHDAAVDHDDVDHDAAVDHDDVDHHDPGGAHHHDAAVDHDDGDHDRGGQRRDDGALRPRQAARDRSGTGDDAADYDRWCTGPALRDEVVRLRLAVAASRERHVE